MGLVRFLRARAVEVVEMNRPNRQHRRRFGKHDTAEAEVAARALQTDTVTDEPKSADGPAEMVRTLHVVRRCELMYLPPYTPDFDPIDEAFSKIKRLIRKAEACSREALVEAIDTAISALSAQDACGFFEHCGCSASAQP